MADVEITDIQATHVHADWTWTFVRVYTDAGVTGSGESYWGSGVGEVIEHCSSILAGEDPRNLDYLRHKLFEGLSATGSIAGKSVSAISGIDIALHDLAGKLTDQPAYRLLGGKYRDEARVYVDCHAGDPSEHNDRYSPAAYADKAEAVVSEGFDAIKFDLDATRRYERDSHNRHLNAEAVDYKRRLVEAITDRVGYEADVSFDCHWNYTGDSARRLSRAIEDCEVWWLEDVVPPENLEVQREVTRSTSTSICAGENLYRTHGVRPLIEQQAVDILQPDMPKFGGMRETVRAAHAADDYYIPMALHNVSSPLGTMAGAHVAVSIPNFIALEWHAHDDPHWQDFAVDGDIIEEGRITPPDEPGLGVELDPDTIEEFMGDGETLLDPA